MANVNLRYFSVLAVLSSAFTPADAAVSTSSIQVLADVISSCGVTATSLVYFRNVDTLTTSPVTANGQISVLCAAGTRYTVSLDGGQNGTIGDRKLVPASGSGVLHYQLYTDASFGTIFGDGVNGATVAGTGNGGTAVVPVYGRITDRTGIAGPGTYGDRVTISVAF